MKQFKDMTNDEIISKMNETELNLIDPMFQEMKSFIIAILHGNYFNTNKMMEYFNY